VSTDHRQKWLTIAAVACVGVLVADRVVIGPVIRRFRDRARILRQMEADVSRARALLDQSDTWQQRLADYHDRALPTDPSAAEGQVIKSVREWASRSGLTLTSMRPRWRTEPGERPVLELRVTGKGGISAVTGFLFAAETAQIPLRPVNVSVASAASRPTDLTLSAELHAVVVSGSKDKDAQGGAS